MVPGNVETDILWEPEIGTCSVCREPGCRVRGYTSDGRVRKFCFPCWDSAQEPRVMSSMDWDDEDRVVFKYPPGKPSRFPSEEPPSKAA